MKKVTLKDIAARAGVSIALVSNYLNHHPSARMSKQTQEKIDSALAELDYHCSDIARSLRTGRTNIVGYYSENLRNEVTRNEMLEIYNAAADENYHVIVGFSANRGNTIENLRSFQARGCDAIIVSGFFTQEMLEAVVDLPVPTVILNTHPTSSLPGKMLRYDYQTPMRNVINFLKGQGHTGIYYQTRYYEPHDQRFQEFSRSVSEKNIWCLDHDDVAPGELKSFLAEHPDCSAIMHLNDYLALRTIQNGCAIGLDLPDDLSVIGFDNVRAAEYAVPSLSTISRPLADAAQAAVRAVLSQLEKMPYELPEVLPCEFIRRDSVK